MASSVEAVSGNYQRPTMDIAGNDPLLAAIITTGSVALELFTEIAAQVSYAITEMVNFAVRTFGSEEMATKALFVQTLLKIPPEERREFTDNMLQILSPEMEEQARSQFCEVLLSSFQFTTLFNLEALIRGEMCADERLELMERIVELPVQEREKLMEEVAACFETSPTADGRCDEVLYELKNCRLRLFFTNAADAIVDEAPRATPSSAGDYTYGEGVHSNQRDRRAVEAYELLCNLQAGLSPQQLTDAKDAFLAYLGADPRGVQARAVLDAPSSSTVRGFSPLFMRFTLEGRHIQGENLIGHLWHFASGLGGVEEANAKQGMVGALIDSSEYRMDPLPYGEQGCQSRYLHRICNPGKTVRLITQVLQGREITVGDVTRRVDIDGLDLADVMVPTDQAIEQFFLVPARQNIDDPHELLREGLRFCAANPGVNKRAFIRELGTYCVVNFIDFPE
ncbi:MAG: hypothetical protein SP1CHLAM54_07750 [Chlamydiia bacterium]|nr:hypothetical protein [Chlamydiia bacterium]MCH9615681.1 hypothetical protein [Chlamydiia bacterium]MCH9628916.1 hypothetical protein [Chlamydiia bacterium]